MLLLLLLLSLASASVREALELHAQHTVLPIPMPSDAQLAELESGGVVKVRLPGSPGAPDGAMILAVSELSREALWLGSADSHGEEDRVTAHHLPLRGPEMFRWYGLVDLPRPFADRHFLIRTVINTALSAAQPGMWERAWNLEPSGQQTMRELVVSGTVAGVTPERFDASVYTPTNRGAWLMLDLDDGRTLFGYHAATSLGGDIPDAIVARYAFWGLDEIARTVFSRARAITSHYRAGHAPVRGGAGEPVPFYP